MFIRRGILVGDYGIIMLGPKKLTLWICSFMNLMKKDLVMVHHAPPL